MKYKITVEIRSKPSARRFRTFTLESDKTSEEVRKTTEQEYDMFQIVKVTVRAVQ